MAELLKRLDANSSNSSKPPSSDPPWQLPTVLKTRTGKKPGGQPGHPGAFRRRLPLERVKQVVDYIPAVCGHCQASLAEQADSAPQETSWHQVAELPDVLAEITEHRGHQHTCSCCGKVTCAEIPAAVREHCTGPKLAATLSYMSGCLHASKRALQEVCETLFDVPLSLGTFRNSMPIRVPRSKYRTPKPLLRCAPRQSRMWTKPAGRKKESCAGCGWPRRHNLQSSRFTRSAARSDSKTCWAKPSPASSVRIAGAYMRDCRSISAKSTGRI